MARQIVFKPLSEFGNGPNHPDSEQILHRPKLNVTPPFWSSSGSRY